MCIRDRNIDVYFQANMDLVGVDPIFNLYNDRWPIYTQTRSYPPAKFVFNDEENERVGYATDSLVCDGCIISGGHVHRGVLSPKVLSLIHISEPTRLLSISYAVFCLK